MQLSLALLASLSLVSADLVKVLVFSKVDGSNKGYLGVSGNNFGSIVSGQTNYDLDANNVLVFSPSQKFTFSIFTDGELVLQTVFRPTGMPLALSKAPTKGPQYLVNNSPFYACQGKKYTLGVSGLAVVAQLGGSPPSGCERIDLVVEYLNPPTSSSTTTTSSSATWSNTTVTTITTTNQITSYTTYCPLPTVVTITSCVNANCYPVPVTVTTATTITCNNCVVPTSTVAAAVATAIVGTPLATSISPVANAAVKNAAGFVGFAAAAAVLL